MSEVYIYDMLRVPTGNQGGYYKLIKPESLASFLLVQMISRLGIGKEADLEIILANSIGTQGNMTRYVALAAGLKADTKTSTIDLQCGGSYQSIRMASTLIKSGESVPVICGGLESNSLKPTRIYHKNDSRYHGEVHTSYATFSPESTLTLQQSAENLGKKYGIEKKDLLNWTIKSHEKLAEFNQSELYHKYVLPYTQRHKIDQPLKLNLSIDRLTEHSKENFLVDNTTSAHYHDGAAILFLGNEEFIKKGFKPIAKIHWLDIMGVLPDIAPEGALVIAKKLRDIDRELWNKISLFQINESFGVKPLSFINHFGINPLMVNVLGGNLAYGHPYGASGTIDLMQLLMALQIKKQKFGLLTAGVAGGYGAGIVVENLA